MGQDEMGAGSYRVVRNASGEVCSGSVKSIKRETVAKAQHNSEAEEYTPTERVVGSMDEVFGRVFQGSVCREEFIPIK
jgi:hypothetical protein